MDEEESEDERPRAWNPFTPSGVASFANAPLGHLLTVELVTALLVFLATALYLDRSWATAIDRAVEGFPPGSRIHAGKVDLPGTEALPPSTNHLVGITWSRVDPPGSASDVELHLHPDEWKLSTLFGYVNLPYPPGISQPLNRETLSPRWGAWRSGLLPLAAMAYTTGIVVAWWYELAGGLLLVGSYAGFTLCNIIKGNGWFTGWLLFLFVVLGVAFMLLGRQQ